MLLTRSTSNSKYVIARGIPFISPNLLPTPHLTSLHCTSLLPLSSLHFTVSWWSPFHFTLFITVFVAAFLTPFLNVFKLRGTGPSKSAGKWFQFMIVQFQFMMVWWWHINIGPPLRSSSQSFWLTQRSRVRFPALPDFLSSSGSGTGSTQPLWE
jgi:hypothetical protein